ncbi:hypothetical protein LZ086_07065 [Acinetobacter johnsonii]|nr:hypothetical protein LZ086_07065 [Acinetobacter johnsonii]
MENPEKIEIAGLKTIHKLCKFGADNNMEGCTFTEIVERMFDELAKAQAVPEGFVWMPKEPTQNIYRTFYDAFNSADAGNTAQNFKVAYKAMIEALEPTND